MNEKKLTGNIYWGLMIILLIGAFFNETTFFYIISGIYLLFIVMTNGFRLTFPRIPGFKLYLSLVFVVIIAGCFLYEFRNVARDIYYFTATLIWIFIGTSLTKKKKFNMDAMYKTLCLYAIVNSVVCYISFFIQRDWSFNGIRWTFVTGVYDLDFILPIMILCFVFEKKYAFSKSVDAIMIALLSLHIFLSIGRISILMPIISVVIITIFKLRYQRNKKNSFWKMLGIFIALVCIAWVALALIPEDIKMFFSDKITGTMEEINSTQEFDSTEMAMNNWRGYEMQAAVEQWKSSSFWRQLFGAGMGKGIYIKYVPYSWETMVVNNEIPLLHNGFCTALIKMGVLGFLSLIYFFLGLFARTIKNITQNKNNINVNIIMVLLATMGAFCTYIANGMIGYPFVVWGLLLGMLNTNHFLISPQENT